MLDDDQDMADMYLSRRAEKAEQQGQREAREQLQEPQSPTQSVESVEDLNDADFMGQTESETDSPARFNRASTPLDRNYIQEGAPAAQAPPPPIQVTPCQYLVACTLSVTLPPAMYPLGKSLLPAPDPSLQACSALAVGCFSVTLCIRWRQDLSGSTWTAHVHVCITAFALSIATCIWPTKHALWLTVMPQARRQLSRLLRNVRSLACQRLCSHLAAGHVQPPLLSSTPSNIARLH